MATLIERPVEEQPRAAETPLSTTIMEQVSEIIGRPSRKAGYVWGLLRLSMGWVFFWAFLDKLFGLGYATASDGAWIAGGSPTFGFLNFATKGPFAGFYQSIAGNVVVDWLFMVGLLVVGLPLLLGIGVRLAAFTGVAMLALMYSAGFMLPEHNPFLDEHIIYAIIMIGLMVAGAGRYLGLGNLWARTRLVRKYPVLE